MSIKNASSRSSTTASSTSTGARSSPSERRRPGARRLRGRQVLDTGGTIYPGLIELHNHLSYNVLPLWDVPEAVHATATSGPARPDYRKLITGPMKVLGARRRPTAGARPLRRVQVPARRRHDHARASRCSSNAGHRSTSTAASSATSSRPTTPELPEAAAHIADVEAKDARKVPQAPRAAARCLLLHLSEGTDDAARAHFLALQGPDGDVGDHRRAGRHPLRRPAARRFRGLAEHGGVDGLVAAQQPAALRADRGRRGSQGGGRAASARLGLVAERQQEPARRAEGRAPRSPTPATRTSPTTTWSRLATRNAAAMLRWEHDARHAREPASAPTCSSSPARRGDPHAHLFTRSEHDVELVVINGVPALRREPGHARLLGEAADGAEKGRSAGGPAAGHLGQPTADPDVGGLTLEEATELLSRRTGSDLPELAKGLASSCPDSSIPTHCSSCSTTTTRRRRPAPASPEPETVSSRRARNQAERATPLPTCSSRSTLDALTVSDDNRDLRRERSSPRQPPNTCY